MKKYIIVGVLCISLVILFIFTKQKEFVIEQSIETSSLKETPQSIERTKPDQDLNKGIKKTKKSVVTDNETTPTNKKQTNAPIKKNSSYFNEIFEKEEVDQEWAYSHQGKIYNYYYNFAETHPNLFLDNVVCKKTLCEVSISANKKKDLQTLMVVFLEGINENGFNSNGSLTIKRVILNDGMPRAELYITRNKEW